MNKKTDKQINYFVLDLGSDTYKEHEFTKEAFLNSYSKVRLEAFREFGFIEKVVDENGNKDREAAFSKFGFVPKKIKLCTSGKYRKNKSLLPKNSDFNRIFYVSF